MIAVFGKWTMNGVCLCGKWKGSVNGVRLCGWGGYRWGKFAFVPIWKKKKLHGIYNVVPSNLVGLCFKIFVYFINYCDL